MDKTKKARFNVIDIAVLIIIIAVVGVTLLGYLSSLSADGTRDIVFYLKLKDLSSDYSDSIRVGDKVFNHSDGSLIGTVTDISDTNPDASPPGSDNGGALYISVKAQATKADKGFLVNGTNISAGNSLEVRFPHLFCEAKCVGVENLGT